MPLYAFYCCRPDGGAITFEAHELASRRQARTRAARILAQHRSCSHVVVFEDDVELFTEQGSDRRDEEIAGAVYVGRIDAAALSESLNGLGAERANVAVIATTADGAIAYWNEPAMRLYGWRVDEAIGRNVVDLKAAAQSRAEAETIMARLQAGEAWAGEIVLRRRNGSPLSVFAADVPIGAVAQGEGMIIGASAVVARRKAVLEFQPLLEQELTRRFGPASANPAPQPTATAPPAASS